MIEIIWAFCEHLPTAAGDWWDCIYAAISFLCFSPFFSFLFLVVVWTLAEGLTTNPSLSNNSGSLSGTEYPTTTKAVVRTSLSSSSGNDDSSSCLIFQLLHEELCRHIFSYLNVHDLCHSASLVNREFYHWSVHDMFWEPRTRQLWQGKQNIQRFLRRSDLSWKQRYSWSQVDSKRNVIKREEMTYFQWKLFYDGRQCNLGLRRFLSDGTCDSLHEGTHEWMIQRNHLKFMGDSLHIARNPKDWGWIMGRGCQTEYHSIEPLPYPEEELVSTSRENSNGHEHAHKP